MPGVIVDRMFAGPLHSFDKDDQLDFSPCGPTYSQKKKDRSKSHKGLYIFGLLLDIMIFEEQKMEERMDKLVTKERGNVYVVQHDDIVAALELRDADLAQQRMGAHIDTMLSDVKHQIEQIQALAKEDSVR